VGQRYDFGTEGGLHYFCNNEKGKCICILVERIILLVERIILLLAKSKYVVITEFVKLYNVLSFVLYIVHFHPGITDFLSLEAYDKRIF
jgi:hypothetical protein